MPITWQTVAGNSLENAWRPMQGAVTTFDSGIDRLAKMITDRQTVNQGVADRGREANVQAYLDAVQGAASPEDLKALHDSGHLDQLRANIDPRDAARIRGADEARLTAVQQHTIANREFDDKNKQFTNRDAVNAAVTRAYQLKDPTEAIAMVPADQPNRAEVVQQIVAAAQGNAKFADAHDQSAAQVKRWGDETRIGEAQVGVQQQEANTHAKHETTYANEVGLRTQEALEKRLSDTSQKLVGLQNGLNSPGAQGEIDAFIKTLPNQGDQERMQRAIGRLAANPKYAGMTAEAAIQAARADLSTAGDFRKNWFWNGTGDNIESHADQIVNSDGYKASQKFRNDNINTLQQQREVLRAALYGPSAAGTTLSGPPAPAAVPGAAQPAPATPAAASVVAPAVPALAPATPKAADPLLAKQASIEVDEKAAGLRKDLSPEVQGFLKDKDNADRLALEQAARDQRERQRAVMNSGPKMGSAFGAFGATSTAQVDDLKRRRAALEQELAAAAKKAK